MHVVILHYLIHCIYNTLGYQFWSSNFNNGDNGWTSSDPLLARRVASSQLCPTDAGNCCCILIDPLGYYIHNTTSTKGYKNITLSFDYNGQQSSSGDYCNIELSIDNGAYFFALWQHSGIFLLGQNVMLPLPHFALDHQNIIIRLFNSATTDPGSNYCFFDNIVLTGIEPTNNPTNIPTKAPQTDTPTNIPSTAPTNQPSHSQTNAPTNNPTHIPTNIPSKQPIFVETFQHSLITTIDTDVFVIIIAVDNVIKLDTDEITRIVIGVLTVNTNHSNTAIDVISNEVDKDSITILFTVPTNQLDTDVIERKVENTLEDQYDNIDFDVSIDEVIDEYESTQSDETNENIVTDSMLEVEVVVMVALCIICSILIFIAKKKIEKYKKDVSVSKHLDVSNTMALNTNSIRFTEMTRICQEEIKSADRNKTILETVETNVVTRYANQATKQTTQINSDSECECESDGIDTLYTTQGKTVKDHNTVV